MNPLDRDVTDHPFSIRNARWRTWLRAHTPDVLYFRLGFYYCEVTRPTPPDARWYRPSTDMANDIG